MCFFKFCRGGQSTIKIFVGSSTYLLSKGDEFWSELDMNVNVLQLHLKELKSNLQTLKEYAAQLVRFFDPRLGS